MLTPREATEAPRQGSRSPLSPTEVTESATVRLFLILSALLCSVNNADLKTATWLLYCLRLRSHSPHNAQHSTSWGERERAPTLLMSMEIVYVHTYVHPRSTARLRMREIAKLGYLRIFLNVYVIYVVFFNTRS